MSLYLNHEYIIKKCFYYYNTLNKNAHERVTGIARVAYMFLGLGYNSRY